MWQTSCHIWVISSVNTRGQQCATEIKCIGTPIGTPLKDTTGQNNNVLHIK